MKTAALLFFATFASLFSQTVVNSSGVNGFTGQFRDSNDQVLPFGSLVRVGSFDLSGSNLSVIQTSSDFAQVDALFTPLAESQPGGGSITQAGNTGDTLIINDFAGVGNSFGEISGIADSYLPTNTQLFFWVFNSSATSSATEWAIASSDSMVFRLPASPGATTVTPSGVNLLLRGSKDGDNVLLAPVDTIPEPSSAILMSIGCCLLLGKRRRA